MMDLEAEYQQCENEWALYADDTVKVRQELSMLLNDGDISRDEWRKRTLKLNRELMNKYDEIREVCPDLPL